MRDQKKCVKTEYTLDAIMRAIMPKIILNHLGINVKSIVTKVYLQRVRSNSHRGFGSYEPIRYAGIVLRPMSARKKGHGFDMLFAGVRMPLFHVSIAEVIKDYFDYFWYCCLALLLKCILTLRKMLEIGSLYSFSARICLYY